MTRRRIGIPSVLLPHLPKLSCPALDMSNISTQLCLVDPGTSWLRLPARHNAPPPTLWTWWPPGSEPVFPVAHQESSTMCVVYIVDPHLFLFLLMCLLTTWKMRNNPCCPVSIFSDASSSSVDCWCFHWQAVQVSMQIFCREGFHWNIVRVNWSTNQMKRVDKIIDEIAKRICLQIQIRLA